MATRNYELKKGVLLEAFGDASKTCTNDTITDELGDWYMANQPEKIIYFERVRFTPAPPVNPRITIIPPVVKPVETVMDVAADMIKEVTQEPKKKPVKSRK